jgi:hypothetical protein|tara:strand:+ start:1238 stop:1426 length:189 start_codon:yes stop_codon:yes gene_type:complete
MKKTEWEELDFSPTKDGYWATANDIKNRIAERQLQKRKNTFILWLVVVLSLLFLFMIVWFMI